MSNYEDRENNALVETIFAFAMIILLPVALYWIYNKGVFVFDIILCASIGIFLFLYLLPYSFLKNHLAVKDGRIIKNLEHYRDMYYNSSKELRELENEYSSLLDEYEKLKLTVRGSRYIIGLRYVYDVNKRLPSFICKHCFSTIITKNLNITCPYCSAEFVVTDNDKTKQVGDVKIKSYRNLVNESKMESVLFDECPVCHGIIKTIDCYHCNKEIDLFEHYSESELEKKRYEKPKS